MENNKSVTAVEWLVEQIFKHNNLVKGDGWFYVKPDIIEQAKEMEKEQIISAFVECWKENMPDGYECKQSAEQYYQETYGGNNE
jgi:HEPN domain-containing protein